jgi:hypothetical protein
MFLSIILYLLMSNLSPNNIELTKNQWFGLPSEHFKQATDGAEIKQKTKVWLKYDSKNLYVKFECLDNPFVATNGYVVDNEPLYNQEVFEVFITTQLTNSPTEYLEFEINPNNAIWIGKIQNPTGKAPAKADMIEPKTAEIKHNATQQKDAWKGEFSIPLKLIGQVQNEYKLNFYRIITTKNHTDKKWMGSPKDCIYACLNPTMSGKIPAFHRPASFVSLVLK